MLTPAPMEGARRWLYWCWHAVLMGAFPVLFLFAENVEQQVTLEPLWAPLAVCVGGSIAVLLLCFAFRRDWLRAGLMASSVLALFFSFGHVWNLVDEVLEQRWLLAAIWVTWAILLVQLAWRGGRWVLPATRILNVTLVLLVGYNVLRIGEFALAARVFPTSTGEIPTVAVGEAGRPDIFYIILDRYGGERTLRDIYHYDNQPFLDALEERGFAVAHQSWANYFKTALSLVSSLSMDYLDPEVYSTSNPHNFGPIHAALQSRMAAPATLKTLGYEYVHIGNWWEPSSVNVDADIILGYSQFSEFSTILAATTGLLLVLPYSSPDEDAETLDYPELARRHVLYGFDAIEANAHRPGPTYVFAHLTIPHSPYVFNPDGSMPTAQQTAERTTNEEYVAQLEYANSRTLEVLDEILEGTPGEPDPIVILQADEGPWPPAFAADQDDFQWLEATDEEIAWKFRILNAYRTPGVDLEPLGFYDGISPVNLFRILFDAYFGADLEPLPDVTYLSPDYDHMYDLVPYDPPEP